MSFDKSPQAQHPHGVMGRLFAVLMERMNERTYRWTIDHLRDAKPESFHEIGFGTGRLLELAIRRLHVQRVRGVDPADLMVATATRRLRGFSRKVDIDLRVGDDTSALWSNETFDALAALHSFQFWSNPDATLRTLRGRLSPRGRLVLILRSHGKHPPQWLPNPISRSGDEIEGTRQALVAARLNIVHEQAIDRASHGFVTTAAD
jgi:SAM-dependent methyltransferase